jgi:hydroxyacylglutathione hydrolase
MRQIRPDLWETRADAPFPGLTTHAYLWTPLGAGPAGPAGNVLFYNTAGDEDLEEMARLGGVAHQYLSHQDEVAPMLATYRQRFGTVLHAAAVEADAVAKVQAPDVTFTERHVDANGVEVIPTPGHTPGSTCYLVPGADGLTYLFTGDTLYQDGKGRWRAGYLPFSDAEDLLASLDLLGGLEPDLVASSAFAGDAGVHLLGNTSWADCVAEARTSLERHLARPSELA